MSGTSVDGIDAALVEIIDRDNQLETNLIAGYTYPYADDLRTEILAVCAGEPRSLQQICELDDRIAEPARASLMPGFVDAKRAALEAGALGASISGAGPTAFATGVVTTIIGSISDEPFVAPGRHDLIYLGRF